MMAFAAWTVWKKGGFGRQRVPLLLFLGQLLCNALWSWLFFGLHNPGLAFADLCALWILIALTARAFYHQAPSAALLMVPYLAWVSFAGVLNFTLWRLNR